MPTHIFKNPDEYKNNNSLQYEFAMGVISSTNIKINSRILDIGCGDGAITSRLSDIAAKGCVIGTDISENMIDFASKAYVEKGNLRFIQMDAASNLFREQFDIVTSFNCLHWVKDQLLALKGIANALAPDGKAVLLLSHKKSHYHHALQSTCAMSRWSHFFEKYVNPRSFFDVEEYRSLVTTSGLEVDHLYEKELVHHFKSIGQLKNFLKASMANVKQIPVELINEFLEDYCVHLFNLIDCSKDSIPLGFYCLEVLAYKPAPIHKNDLAVQIVGRPTMSPKS